MTLSEKLRLPWLKFRSFLLLKNYVLITKIGGWLFAQDLRILVYRKGQTASFLRSYEK